MSKSGYVYSLFLRNKGYILYTQFINHSVKDNINIENREVISEARKEEAGCESGSSRTEFPCGDRTLLYLGCGDGCADLCIRDIDAYMKWVIESSKRHCFLRKSTKIVKSGKSTVV